MPYVLLMIDEAGEYPIVVDENDKLLTHGSAQWRLIAEVDTRAEGEEVAAAWRRAKASYSHGPKPGPRPSKTPDANGG